MARLSLATNAALVELVHGRGPWSLETSDWEAGREAFPSYRGSAGGGEGSEGGPPRLFILTDLPLASGQLGSAPAAGMWRRLLMLAGGHGPESRARSQFHRPQGKRSTAHLANARFTIVHFREKEKEKKKSAAWNIFSKLERGWVTEREAIAFLRGAK